MDNRQAMSQQRVCINLEKRRGEKHHVTYTALAMMSTMYDMYGRHFITLMTFL